jgi:FkbM family methyltransferase
LLTPGSRQFLLQHPYLLSVLVAIYGEKYRRKYGCKLRFSPGGGYLALRKGQRELRLSISHNNYIDDAAQRLDYYLDAIVPESVGGKEVGDFTTPRLHRIRGVEEQFLFTSFPEGLDTANAYFEAFHIQPGDVVIDAGAYCGLTAYLFSKAVGPTGTVVAIEADPRNYEALRANLDRLEAPNIIPIHAAVWREKGVVDFASEGNMGSAVLEVSPTKPHRVSVPSLTLSDICAQLSLTRVDHVKMDIEGAEYEVIPASGKFIETYRPDFLIEMHLEKDGGVNVEKLRKYFSELRYDMRTVPQPGDEIFPLLHFASQPEMRAGG